MSERRFILTVPGDPIPQGSKTVATAKNGRSYVRDDNPRLKPWREKITAAAKFEISDRHHGKWEPMEGPLLVDVMFFLKRPPSQYGSGRNSDRVLPSAPVYPIAMGGGDVDKLARAALDSLTAAGVIVDDSRVVDLVARKCYAAGIQKPGLSLVVQTLSEVVEQVTTVVALQEALL